MVDKKKTRDVEKVLKVRYKGRGLRKCRFCGNTRGIIRKYRLYVCRRCFRNFGEKLGFRKY